MYQLCRHIMPSGSRCQSTALSGTYFCYFHTRLHNKVNDRAAKFEESVRIPVLENRAAIQLALSQVLNAFGSKIIDSRQAHTLLYGLQIASQNFGRCDQIGSYSGVESVTSSEDGDDLAPEEHRCAGNEDCDSCPYKDTCEDREDDEEEGDDEEEEEDQNGEFRRMLAMASKALGHPL
jgi:hypothetical protein